MRRVKWLQIGLPISISAFSKGILGMPFDEVLGRGFKVVRSTKNEIEGAHVFKFERVELVVSPDGEEVSYLITEYQVIKFYINYKTGLLRVIDYPRSLKNFANDLYGISGVGFYIREIEIDPLALAEIVSPDFQALSVVAIEACDVAVSKDVGGRVRLHGGRDIRNDFRKFMSGKKFNIVSVEAAISLLPGKKKVVFNSKAGLKIFSEEDGGMLEAFERGILALSLRD